MEAVKKVIYVNDGGNGGLSSFSEGGNGELNSPKLGEETKQNGGEEGGILKNEEYVKTAYEEQHGGRMDGEGDSDVMSVNSNKNGDGGVGFAGGAKRTSLSSVSSEDTIESQALLEIDPMYIRLTKFLETSGTNKKNLADVVDNIASSLKDLNATFDKINSNLEKILKLQQNSV